MISYRFSVFSIVMTNKGDEILSHFENLENELLHKSKYFREYMVLEIIDLLIADKEEK